MRLILGIYWDHGKGKQASYQIRVLELQAAMPPPPIYHIYTNLYCKFSYTNYIMWGVAQVIMLCTGSFRW